MQFETLMKKCRGIEKRRTDTIVYANELVADNEFQLNGKKLDKSAHSNLRSLLNIPPAYYWRMFIDGDLWAYNVNTWLSSFSSETAVMVRETTSSIYAIMSPSYRRVSDSDLLVTIRPMVEEYNFIMDQHTISKTEMSCSFRSPSLNFDVSVGDVVQGGFYFYNSQDGSTRMGMNAYFYRLECENGLTFPSSVVGLTKMHLTRPNPVGEMSIPDLLDVRSSDRIEETFKDIIAEFPLLVTQMKGANKKRLSPGIDERREILGKVGFGKNHIELISDEVKDESYWGVLNAATHWAKDKPNRKEIELRASKILELV